MKTLVVFDFDDTLFRSGAMIGVQRPGQPKRYLSSHQYATYKPKKDEQFDYDQFQVYPPDPQPIKKSAKRFIDSVSSQGSSNVIILTARSESGPVEQVLKNFGMPSVKIFAIGSANPDDKARVVQNLVLQKKYQRVIIYEDSSPNIAAIRKRLAPLLGEKIIAYKVKASTKGSTLQREAKKGY